MDKQEFDHCPGYCLQQMEPVQFFWPQSFQGVLFSCPHCGQIDSPELQDLHLWRPSAPLIEILARSKEHTPACCAPTG
jgi:hypothetical protein